MTKGLVLVIDHLGTDRHLLDQPIQGTICAELTEVSWVESAFKSTMAHMFDVMIARGVPAPLLT